MNIPDTLLSLPWVKVNIYIYLRRKAGADAVCAVPLSELAAEFSITRPTASRYIREMEKDRYFTIGKQTFYNNGQMRYRNLTVISFRPNKLSHVGGQALDNPGQSVDNPGQPLVKSGQTLDKSLTVAERKNRFASDLQPYLDKYGRDTLNAFFLYWTQVSDGGRKMLYEKQRSFQIPNRLAAWKRNNYGPAPHDSPHADGTIYHQSQMNVNKGGW